MKGLDLAERYYEDYGKAMIEAVLKDFPTVQPAVGLVGEGSQCFGFDDALSHDHDFAPGFCIWLSDEDFRQAGAALQTAYDALPAAYLGFDRSNIIAGGRLGVLPVGGFYQQFTGCAGTPDLPGLPQSNIQWFMAPENPLAAATNGKVFSDPSGIFSEVRRRLLNFYPEDVLRKKIAARAAVMSQAGQYNLLRVIKRGDRVAAMLAAARFTEAALSMIYLLNRKYMPFYKWAFHGAVKLPLLADCAEKLKALPAVLGAGENMISAEAHRQAYEITESICTSVSQELLRQGLSAVKSSFLQDHLADIMSGIRDPQIGRMHPMADYNG